MGRGYSVWLRGHVDEALGAACEKADLVPLGDQPGMVLDVRVEPAKPIAGVDFTPLDGMDAVREFFEVAMAGYQTTGMSEAPLLKTFEQPERLLQPHLLGIIAREGGRPLPCKKSPKRGGRLRRLRRGQSRRQLCRV